MKNSNKILLIIFICFLTGIIFEAFASSQHSIPIVSFIAGKKTTQSPNLSDKNVTKSFNVDSFSELEVNGSSYVSIKSGKKPNISVSTHESYLNNINISPIGNKVCINVSPKIGGNYDKKADFTIIVNQPLKKITTNGTSHINYTNINNNNLILEASGSSQFYLSGKVKSLQIETSGASHIDTKNLMANDVSLETSGTTSITVYAKNSLKINSSGMAHINYYGNPQNVIRNISGIANIKNGD